METNEKTPYELPQIFNHRWHSERRKDRVKGFPKDDISNFAGLAVDTGVDYFNIIGTSGPRKIMTSISI